MRETPPPNPLDAAGEAIADAAWERLSARVARLEETDLTVAQVAKRLRKRDSFVRSEIAAGRLRAMTLEGDLRIAPRWMDAYEEMCADELEAERRSKMRLRR